MLVKVARKLSATELNLLCNVTNSNFSLNPPPTTKLVLSSDCPNSPPGRSLRFFFSVNKLPEGTTPNSRTPK